MSKYGKPAPSEAKIQRALEKVKKDRETEARERGEVGNHLAERQKILAESIEREKGQRMTWDEFLAKLPPEWLEENQHNPWFVTLRRILREQGRRRDS